MKVAKILAIIFGILTICGGIYVISSGGQVNAGYAVIPMVFCLVFSAMPRKRPKDKQAL